jgi:transcriptional regulator with XRE-family HTH domain
VREIDGHVATGAGIKAARKRRGLTQAELADKIGTRQSVISRIESDKHLPSLSTLIRMAAALDMELYVVLRDLNE